MIPALFCSWTGDALDVKTPLIRSTGALSNAAKKLLHIIDGNEKVEQVHTTLGPEQEFFVIDRSMYVARPDLVFTGRTVLGAKPPKGQVRAILLSLDELPTFLIRFIGDGGPLFWNHASSHSRFHSGC
jgi:glutamine synthetase type III